VQQIQPDFGVSPKLMAQHESGLYIVPLLATEQFAPAKSVMKLWSPGYQL
jgi:hypothetical protein